MAGKIQNEDIKSVAELTGAGATAASLPNDDKIYVTASGINKTLKQAIIDGDIGAGLTDPMTTAGDIIIRNGSNVTARLPVGSNGQVLKVSGGVPAWGTDNTGGGGGGSTYTLSGILSEILSDEADTFIPSADQFVDDFDDAQKGTKTTCAQSGSALRFTGTNLSAVYERVKVVTNTMSSIDGGAIMSAQAIAPKNTAASPSATSTSVTFKIQGDVTNIFADTKKVLIAKRIANNDGAVGYIGLKSGSALAELAISGSPSYNAGLDETTIVISNPSSLDLDFDLSSSSYNDQLRFIPFDYKFEVKSKNSSGYEQMPITNLSALSQVRIPGENFFTELFNLTGSCRKQDMAKSPNGQYWIVRIAEYVGTPAFTWHFGYSTNSGATWTKFSTTKTAAYHMTEETGGYFEGYNPNQLAVADNGKAIWFYSYTNSTSGYLCTDALYSDLTAGLPALTPTATTGNDSLNNEGTTAGRVFSQGSADDSPCIAVAANLTDLSYIAAVGIDTSAGVMFVRWFSNGGATHVGISSTSYSGAASEPHMIFINGSGSSHRTTLIRRDSAAGYLAHTYWDQGSLTAIASATIGTTNINIVGGSLSNNRLVMLLKDNSNSDLYHHTASNVGFGLTPSWGSQRNLSGNSSGSGLLVDTYNGWNTAQNKNLYKTINTRAIQKSTDEKDVAIVCDIRHNDGWTRPLLIESIDVTADVPLEISQFTHDEAGTFRDSAATTKNGQTFTAVANTPKLRTAAFLAHQVGYIPSGYTIQAELYATSGGLPTGSVLATSINSYDPSKISKTTASGQWLFFNFDNYTLVNGTMYAVVLTGDFPISGSNYIGMRAINAGAYGSGTRVRYDGSSWVSATSDQTFFISSVYYRDVSNTIETNANRAAYGYDNNESQIAHIDSSTAQITWHRHNSGSGALKQLSGHPFRRIFTWGTGGSFGTVSDAKIAGYASTNFDENLVFATALGSPECQRQNTSTGVLDANSSGEDRSGSNIVTAAYTNITSADIISDASFQSGYGIDFDGSTEDIQYSNRSDLRLFYNKPFCIEAEVYVIAAQTNMILSHKDSSVNAGFQFYIDSSNKIVMHIANSAGTVIGTRVSNEALTLNTYYRVKASHDGSSGQIKLWYATSSTGSFTECTYASTTNYTSDYTDPGQNMWIGNRYGSGTPLRARVGYIKFANGSETFAYNGFKNQAPLVGHLNLGTRILAENKVGQNSASSGTNFDNIGIINGAANQASMVDSNDIYIKFGHTISGTTGNELSFRWTGGRVSTRDITALEAVNIRFVE